MKKNAVLYHVLGPFLCPLFFICMFTLISSLATANYEYLPKWLDGMSVFFYELAAYALDFTVFFLLGSFAFAVSQKKIFHSVFTGIAALFHAWLLPMIQFFIRSLVLTSSTEAEIMEEYWTVDVVTSMANTLKVFVGLLICVATFVFFNLTKRTSRFARPYIAPFGVPAVSGIIMSGALIVFAMLSFAFGGAYDSEVVIALLVEILISLAGYFVIILGAYSEKHFSEMSK